MTFNIGSVIVGFPVVTWKENVLNLKQRHGSYYKYLIKTVVD